MHIKTIRRDDWHRILEKEILTEDFSRDGISGKISLLYIKEVSEPLAIDYESSSVKIVEKGYTWVQIAPEGQYYWITSMFDEKDRLLEIYIDMTDGNVTDTADPWFADLYLDYVVHIQTDTVLELDRDELDAAYRSGAISRQQYIRTLEEGRSVFRYLTENRGELETLLKQEQARLKRKSGFRLQKMGNGEQQSADSRPAASA